MAISDMGLKLAGVSGPWNYADKVNFAEFLKLANDDIGQTNRKVIDQGAHEDNPLVAPFYKTGSKDFTRTMGFLGQMLLAKRWMDMKNAQQRQGEMMLAKLIEAAALKYSGEPFQMSLISKEF
jgi:hypothetical protein